MNVYTWNELTEAEKEAAIERQQQEIMYDIIQYGARFGDEIDRKIDIAIDKAERMRTPWFASEYIVEACDSELRQMAIEEAKHGLYPDASVFVVTGVVRRGTNEKQRSD